MAGCAEEGIRKITAAFAAVILVFGLDYWAVLAIFVGNNGRHPGKNCTNCMDNPNKTNLLKQPCYGFELSKDGSELFLCRYRKPRWRLRLEDAATGRKKLIESLHSAAEWLAKRQG